MAKECIWMAECGTDARVHMVFTGKARNRVTLLQICVRVVSGRWDCCVLGHLIKCRALCSRARSRGAH